MCPTHFGSPVSSPSEPVTSGRGGGLLSGAPRTRPYCSRRAEVGSAAVLRWAAPPRDSGARRLRSGGLRRARAQRPGLPPGVALASARWNLPSAQRISAKTARSARVPVLHSGDKRKNRPKCTRSCPPPGGQAQKPPEVRASPPFKRGEKVLSGRTFPQNQVPADVQVERFGRKRDGQVIPGRTFPLKWP